MFENDIAKAQEIRHLKTQSLHEWCTFFTKEIAPVKIIPTAFLLYTDTYVVKCSEDFIFMSSTSAEHKVEIQNINKCFYLIATSGKIRGINGDVETKLPLGGCLLFDENQPFSYIVGNEQDVICLLFPYSYFKNKDEIKKIAALNKVPYNDFILNLIKSMHYSDDDLLFKMKAIANLLLSNKKQQQILTREDYDLNNIINIINHNVLSSKLSLDFISSSLGMSTSKIQKILSKSKMTYSERIKNARVDALAWKIKHYKYKTLFELCYDCGFNSVSNAAVQFKNVKGISISQYKQNLKIEEECQMNDTKLNN